MKLLTAQTGGWADLDDADEVTPRLRAFLNSVLMAERLVVLTGLGTSLCLKDEDGDSVAPTMKDLWDAAAEIAGDSFNEIKTKAAYRHRRGVTGNIEQLLTRCQMALALHSDDELEEFVDRTEAEIVRLCRFVDANLDLSVHEEFLRRVARRSSGLPRTQIFTTNYDLAFEEAASRIGFAVIDGFSHAHPQRFDGIYFEHDFATRDRERSAVPVDWVPNVVQLHKLHGSVDWAVEGDAVRRDAAAKRPLIIYPRASKFEVSYQQPFLELMSRFQSSLRRPDTGLIIVGSGFNDDHIAQPVMAAIRANVRMSAVVISPGLETASNAHLHEIKRLIERGDRRLALFAASFEEAVALLPDLVAQTEQERHEQRLLAARDD